VQLFELYYKNLDKMKEEYCKWFKDPTRWLLQRNLNYTKIVK
jgi:hypothetical protein